MVRERLRDGFPGVPVLLLVLAGAVGLFANVVRLIGERAFPGLIVFSIIGSVLLVVFMLSGFFIVNPNEGRVLQFFGSYVGTSRKTGLQWLVPTDARTEFAITIDRMALTLRRLLAGRLIGMLFEGILIWIALTIGGVPMALVLGLIAGVLAFIPNIGAIITGVLMVAVGFSAGINTGWWAVATYFIVQNFDGYVVIPMVARRTVDMPPALTLSSQILASTLFGVIGLALADPMVAMIKVALERNSERAIGEGSAA